MALGGVTRESVLAAMDEFDELGREAFLNEYGFGPARTYFVLRDGNQYDSKAIYGVAYGLDHPDEGPLTYNDFSSGEATVVRQLEELDFEVVRSPAEPARPRVWMIRAGESGEAEELAVRNGVAVIGWSALGPLSTELSRDQLKTMIRETFSEEREASLGQSAGEIYRFIHDVRVDDLVVLPLKTNQGHIAVGRLRGEYRHRADGAFAGTDAQNTRDVEWLASAVPYSRFDEDLQGAFGQQGTLREIARPDAAERLLAVTRTTRSPALHLLLRWSTSQAADTATRHRVIADAEGAVWWGKLGDPEKRAAVAAKRLGVFESQLARGVETHVYLHRPGETWKTTLVAIQRARPESELGLIPEYYRDETGTHHLWLKLTNFEEVEPDYLENNLILDGSNDPESISVAFRGQASLLYVREQDPGASAQQGGRAYWWVNQGTTYKASRDGGFLWAPTLDKAGNKKPSWDRLDEADVGDVVLHYENSRIRAVGRVEAQAIPSERPAEFPAQDAWHKDGRRLAVSYRELPEPVSLDAISPELRKPSSGPFTSQGSVQQGYFFRLSDEFVGWLDQGFPELELRGTPPPAPPAYVEPSFESIVADVTAKGMRLAADVLRRYHLSLKTRGFVVLAGVSGSGKTWLAELYAEVVSARAELVAVAPNWTTNEDLLGYMDPLEHQYRDTPFSLFLREAAAEYESAREAGQPARPFHLILDEMNLARVEYYFAKFLSAMEVRARSGTAVIELAAGEEVLLTPNLLFIGTVNVDETTHGFADKVYDRAQLVEVPVSRALLLEHLDGRPYRDFVIALWDKVRTVAPFAFRTLDDFAVYTDRAAELGVGWETALDEQILQKVLPKFKGAELGVQDTLKWLLEETDGRFPLTNEKARGMLEHSQEHGFTDYFA